MDTVFSFIQSGLSAIVPFVVLLGILIFIHELGHFLVARWCGVRVEVFSLGFGKKILQYKSGDTVYALSIIPLGGYVKMFGEQPNSEIPEEEKSVSFTHKKVSQRIAIVLAGPMMNFIFAVFIFSLIAFFGEEARIPRLGDVKESTAAYAAGLRSGDMIVKVNNEPILTMEQVQKILNQNIGQIVKFDIVNTETSESKSINANVLPKENPNILSRDTTLGNIEGLFDYAKGTTLGVSRNSLLATFGIKTGDEVIAINKIQIKYWRELEEKVNNLDLSQPLQITIQTRNEKNKIEQQELTLSVEHLSLIKPTDDVDVRLKKIGLQSSELFVGKIVEKSPAAAAGLFEGDQITSVNNQEIKNWEEVVENIKSFDGKNPVELTVNRSGEIKKLQITPIMTSQTTVYGTEDKRYTIGIISVPNVATPELMIYRAEGVFPSIQKGFQKTIDVTYMTIMSFVRIFENKISPKNIGGVISIGQAASETFKIGLLHFFQMMAAISVNLFVLNLLPVPVLDGGHLLFYTIEILKGSPLSMSKLEIAQQVGLALLMSLMVFALFNDFTRILGL